MSEEIFYRARWVLPVDRPAIEGGIVGVTDGLITSLAKSNGHPGATTDLGDVVLLPGLVNAHSHLEFSYLDKPLGASGMALPDWIRLVIAERNRANNNVSEAIRSGIEQSHESGVCAVGDIATISGSDYPETKNLQLFAFQEVIGFSYARMDSVLADVSSRINASVATCSGISPHAPYTVHPLLVTQLVDLAKQNRLPVAMHLAESKEELQLLKEKSGPFQELLKERSMWDPEALSSVSRPMDYLKMLSRASRSLVIHGNYLDMEEIKFLASNSDNMSVVYCPRTHGFFRHSAYPLSEMLQAGVHIALGTDSRASNPDLSLLHEMRYLHQVYPDIPSELILKLGTLAGAKALGLDAKLGSITPGKLTELVVIPCTTSTDNPYLEVLEGGDLIHLPSILNKLS